MADTEILAIAIKHAFQEAFVAERHREINVADAMLIMSDRLFTKDRESIADAMVSIATALHRIADAMEAQNENETSPKPE